MLKDVKYTGLNTVSNAYDATAGQLAVAHNVINERGYIEPLAPAAETIPYTSTNGLEGYMCMFKHEMLSGTVNYIFYKPADNESSDDSTAQDVGSLKSLTLPIEEGAVAQEITWQLSSPVQAAIADKDNLFEITAIGNTLCILTAAGLDYVIWKNGEYKELGTELPFANLEFGLELFPDSDYFTLSSIENCCDSYQESYEVSPGRTPEQMANLRNGIEAALAVARDKAASNGRFMEPFLVRYALRLFDGTYTHHSNPVLMMPCGKSGVPFLWNNYTSGPGEHGITLMGDFKSAKLKMKSFTNASEFDDWKDIVSGIDIFVSQPIPFKDYSNITNTNAGNRYRNTTSAPDTTTDGRGYFAMCKYTDNSAYATSTTDYQFVKFRDVTPGAQISGTVSRSGNMVYADFFTFADTDVMPDRVSLFYNIKELNIQDLNRYTSGITDVVITPNKLQNLATQPILPDDYKSHDQLIPKGAYAYNQRINLFDVSRRSWNRLLPSTMIPYWDEGETCTVRIYITLNDEQGEHILDYGEEEVGVNRNVLEQVRYLYVPYSSATKATLYYTFLQGGSLLTKWTTEIELKRHPSLNGAVYFNSWDVAPDDTFSDYPESHKAEYSEINKIYTSEVGNPFYFPIGGINTVGTGKIVALASNVRAISQGQFGEFPLYVFTETGIWMLEVDDKGLYKAKQPMSLDRIMDGSKVTSVDNAVAYVIERGLMLVSGSETKCISEVLDGKLEALPSPLGGEAPTVEWDTFKRNVECAYDSVNLRLHVYNPNYAYHYVYSVRTGLWSTEDDTYNLLSTINGNYVNTSHGLLDMTLINNAYRVQTIMTRPISFESDAYKRMRDNIQRGDIDALRIGDDDKISVLLQGSDDLINWVNIGAVTKHYKIVRRSGTPHKWFRWKIVIESYAGIYRLHGLTADVEVTGNNKLR